MQLLTNYFGKVFKGKKKVVNILILITFIFHKNHIKTFFK